MKLQAEKSQKKITTLTDSKIVLQARLTQVESQL